jgi:hypothetical protein
MIRYGRYDIDEDSRRIGACSDVYSATKDCVEPAVVKVARSKRGSRYASRTFASAEVDQLFATEAEALRRVATGAPARARCRRRHCPGRVRAGVD